MPDDLIARTGRLKNPAEASAALTEYLKSPPDGGAALVDVLVTSSIVFGLRTVFRLAKEHGFKDLSTSIPPALLEDRARRLKPVLVNGVVVGGTVADAARQTARRKVFHEGVAACDELLRVVLNTAIDELASLLIDGHSRAQVEGVTQADAYKDAETYYKQYLEANYDDALTGFRRLKELAPSDAYFRNMLGAIHMQRGEDELALRELLLARELDPANAHAGQNLLFVLVRLGLMFPAATLGQKLIGQFSAQAPKDFEPTLTLAEVAGAVAVGVASFMAGVTPSDIAGDSLDLEIPAMGSLSPPRLESLLAKSNRDRGGLIDQALFISYRRADTGAMVARFHDRVTRDFSRIKVFRDVDSMLGAEDVNGKVGKELQQAKLVLVFIGPEWLQIRDKAGRRRLDDSTDLVRREVASALRQGKIVAPILVDGATMPAAELLPAELRELPGRNAYKMSTAAFDTDCETLLDELSGLMRAWKEATARRTAELSRKIASGEELIFDLPRFVEGTAGPGEGIPEAVFNEYGEWECTITARGVRQTLKFTIDQRPGYSFEGTLQAPRSGLAGMLGSSITSALVGKWAKVVDVKVKRVLGLQLTGVQDQSVQFNWIIPMTADAGEGYFGTASDGVAYFSRNVRPRTRLL